MLSKQISKMPSMINKNKLCRSLCLLSLITAIAAIALKMAVCFMVEKELSYQNEISYHKFMERQSNELASINFARALNYSNGARSSAWLDEARLLRREANFHKKKVAYYEKRLRVILLFHRALKL